MPPFPSKLAPNGKRPPHRKSARSRCSTHQANHRNQVFLDADRAGACGQDEVVADRLWRSQRQRTGWKSAARTTTDPDSTPLPDPHRCMRGGDSKVCCRTTPSLARASADALGVARLFDQPALLATLPMCNPQASAPSANSSILVAQRTATTHLDVWGIRRRRRTHHAREQSRNRGRPRVCHRVEPTVGLLRGMSSDAFRPSLQRCCCVRAV